MNEKVKLTDYQVEKTFDHAKSKIAMLTITRDSIIQGVTEPLKKMFRYREGELIGKSLNILLEAEAQALHPTHVEKYFDVMDDRLMNTRSGQFVGVCKDGTKKNVLLTLCGKIQDGIETATGIVVELPDSLFEAG